MQDLGLTRAKPTVLATPEEALPASCQSLLPPRTGIGSLSLHGRTKGCPVSDLEIVLRRGWRDTASEPFGVPFTEVSPRAFGNRLTPARMVSR